MHAGDEESRLKAAALQNAQSIQRARRLAEEDLRAQSEWLRVTLASIGDAVITTDAEGRVTFMNSVAESLTGWRQGDALGLSLPEVFHIVNELTRERVESPAVRTLRDGTIVGLANHTVLVAKDGAKRPIDDSAAPIKSQDGRIVGSVLIFRDITERHSADEALRVSEAFSRSVFESSPDCVKIIDAQGHLLRMNANGLRLMEMDDFGPLRGRKYSELWSAEARPDVESALRAAYNGGTGRFQHSCPTAKGTMKHWDVRCAPIRDASGMVSSVVCVSRDITDYQRAQNAIRESEQRFRVMSDAAPVLIWVSGPDKKCNWVNSQWLTFVGRPMETVIGDGWTEFVHPDDRGASYQTYIEAFEARRPFATEFRMRRQDGEYRWLLGNGAPRHQPDGTFAGYIGSCTDVTDFKRAERELREGQARSERERRVYEAILTNTPDFAYVFGKDHKFMYANQVLLNMYGRSWDQAIGKELEELGYEPWHADMHRREIDEVIRTKRPIRGEVPFTGTTGRRIYDYIFVPVFDAKGEVEAVAGTTRDVTARKEAETEREALLESERHARAEAERASRVKEEFLATLSHELRTPLNAILGWLHILRKKPATPETLEQGLSVIDRNARMQAQLIADLLDMSRIISGKMRIDVQRVELPVVIEAALESVRPAADARELRILSELETFSDAVHGDPARIQQVVWNLLSNAVKFTPRGGTVRISLRRAGTHVDIGVTDTGRGIKPEFLPHVFERFRQADSSAAREQGGLGLGLAIVKQLVELHGGTVHVTSEGEGKGATFIVQLPLAVPSVMRHEKRVRAADDRQHSLLARQSPDLTGVTVLVVDDEPDARELIRQLLTECNANVLVAASANQALEMLSRQLPDVILSDIGMPERDGYVFMNAVRRSGLKIPAAALTAFARSEDRTRALQAGYQTHIVKPVEPTELLATVAALAHKTGDREQPAS